MSPRARTALFLATGAVWAFRSLHTFTDPEFSDPDSLNDWVAVLSFTLALAIVGPAMLALPVRGWRRWLLAWTAAAGIVAGLANFVEDGLGLEWGAVLYVVGTAALVVGLFASSVGLILARPRWPGGVCAVTLVGMLQLENAGGLMVLAAWGFAAVMIRRPTPPG